MHLLDLSHPYLDRQPAFPGDPRVRIQQRGTFHELGYHITQIEIGTHHGTHLDAMYHYLPDGRTIDQMPLEWFHGPAAVIRLPRGPGSAITRQDLEPYAAVLVRGARIMIDTGWSQHIGRDTYFTAFPSFTLDAAAYLAECHIRMLGLDTPSPSLTQSSEVHRVLLAKPAEIVIVENLANLDKAPERFTFAGFPLNFQGRDGSPIRAVAICE